MPLTPKQQCFVDEYLIDLNATQAAIRAGYSARTANEQGARLLANASVAAAIQAGQAERSERTQITADQVLVHWWDVATADPNELIEYRRGACRYCHGEGHLYQRTASEWRRHLRAQEQAAARQRTAKQVAKARDDGDAWDVPAWDDPAGGDGYDATRAPHPACPECHGEGVGYAHAKDTRHLSAAAQRLYAGVKVTKDGMEVKMHDQAAALVNVAKHLGMFVEKHEHAGTFDVNVNDVRDRLARRIARLAGRN